MAKLVLKTPFELKVEELLPSDIKVRWSLSQPLFSHYATKEIDGETYAVPFFIPDSQKDITKQAKILVALLETAFTFDGQEGV